MAPLTLLVGILLDLLTAVMLGYVGLRMIRLADQDIHSRRTMWFWYGASAFMMLDGGFAILILNFDVPYWIATAVLLARRLLFTMGWFTFGAWLFHLNYGKVHRHWWTYAAIATTALFVQTWHQGVGGYHYLPWSIELLPEYTTPFLLAALFGPVIFGPTAFLAVRLLLWVPRLSPIQRYRVIVISSSIIIFSALIVIGLWDNQWFWYGLMENRSVFSVATGVLIAMRPPFLLRWRGIPRMDSIKQFPGCDHALPPPTVQ